MNLSCTKTIDCKQGAIRAVRYNVDGNYCLTCGSDKKLKLWNPQKSLLLKTYGGHGDEVLDASGSCDSSHIVSCSTDKSVILWDVTTGQPIRRFRGHASAVKCVKFNEDSSIAVSGSKDNTVMCWDLKSRNNGPFQVLKEAKDCITSIQISDHEILTGSVDCKIRIYDIRVGKIICDFLGEPITSVNFTKDGQCILASCVDDTLRLMDKDTGEMLGEFKGHTMKDFAIESIVSQNDTHVMSGSIDSAIYVWDLVSGVVTNKLIHPKIENRSYNVIYSLHGHPKRNEILSASGNFIFMWEPEHRSEEQSS
ncbi:WD repeat domain-containing protein 83 [Chrysoperla carnea]|uniref:WD repeat domain-containing protein 83 n=1 Tax=Chrysoperla carnea TaxID=189513 RepID=UPI001D07675F|nr:WD repeat domain-containing protein 83 [Chrysoperla carnea]